MAENNKNFLLPQLDNQWLNAGVAHILRHKSVAMELFGDRKQSRFTHYNNQISIRYNQWQKKMVKYQTGLSHDDLPRGTSTEQYIPLTEHGCVGEMISNDIMKRAMGSPEALAEFIADKIEQAVDRGMFEIDQKFIDDICDDKNYKDGSDPDNSTAIFQLPKKDFEPGKDDNGMEKFRKVINSVISTATAMCWPSPNFNHYKLVSTNTSFKNMGVVISTEMFGQSQDYYGNIINPAYTEFKSQFAWVRVLPIYDPKYNEIEGNEEKPKRDKHIILIHTDGYILDVDKESATGFDQSRQAFRETYFYKWIDAYQDVAKGYNMVCYKEKSEVGKEGENDEY